MIDARTPLLLGSGSPRRREILASLGVPIRVAKAEVDETVLPGEGPEPYLVRVVAAKLAAALALPEVQGCSGVLVADTSVIVDGVTLGKPEGAAGAREMLRALSGRAHEVWTRFAVGAVSATPVAASSATAGVASSAGATAGVASSAGATAGVASSAGATAGAASSAGAAAGAASTTSSARVSTGAPAVAASSASVTPAAVVAETVRTKVWFRALDEAEIAAYADTGEGLDKAGAYAIQGVGAFAVERIEGSYSNVVGLPACEVVLALKKAGLLGTFPLPGALPR